MIFGAIYAHWTAMVLHDKLEDVLVLHLVPSLWINMGMLYHYLKSVIESPGRPRTQVPQRRARGQVCDVRVPERNKHCYTCGECCAEMDHHCPFTANCVGRDNYRFFFGFVFWAWVAACYAVWLTRLPRTYCALPTTTSPACATWVKSTGSLHIASTASLAALSALWVFVCYLLATGQTTRQFLRGKGRGHTPRDAADARDSWKAVQRRIGHPSAWWRYLVPGTTQGIATSSFYARGES